MKKYDIPTADYQVFDKFKDAITYIDTVDLPLVVKAEGLAAGKGVIIAKDRDEAKAAVKDIMINKTLETLVLG